MATEMVNVMVPAQFTHALEVLGLSSQAAARILGTTDRSINRYISGERSIPPSLAKLIRLAIARKITVEQIESA